MQELMTIITIDLLASGNEPQQRLLVRFEAAD